MKLYSRHIKYFIIFGLHLRNQQIGGSNPSGGFVSIGCHLCLVALENPLHIAFNIEQAQHAIEDDERARHAFKKSGDKRVQFKELFNKLFAVHVRAYINQRAYFIVPLPP